MVRQGQLTPDGQEMDRFPTRVIDGDYSEILISGYEGMTYSPFQDDGSGTEGRVTLAILAGDTVARTSLTADDITVLQSHLDDAREWALTVNDNGRQVKLPTPMPMGPWGMPSYAEGATGASGGVEEDSDED